MTRQRCTQFGKREGWCCGRCALACSCARTYAATYFFGEDMVSKYTHEKQFVCCCCCYRFVNEGSVCARTTGVSQRSRSRCSFDLLAFVRSSRARWRRACAERKEVGSVTSHSLRRVPSKRRCSRAHLALNRGRCRAPCELCSTQPDREEALVAKCQL